MSRCRFLLPSRLAVTGAVLAILCLACDTTNHRDGDTSTAVTPLPAPPAPASAASSMADTVPLETLVHWDGMGALQALRSDGLEPHVLRTEIAYAGLANGTALRVATAEAHLFFYGDIAAADAAYRQLDATQLRPMDPRATPNPRPRALINNNMLMIVFGGDDALRQRIARALTPGNEDRRAEEEEP